MMVSAAVQKAAETLQNSNLHFVKLSTTRNELDDVGMLTTPDKN